MNTPAAVNKHLDYFIDQQHRHVLELYELFRDAPYPGYNVDYNLLQRAQYLLDMIKRCDEEYAKVKV